MEFIWRMKNVKLHVALDFNTQKTPGFDCAEIPELTSIRHDAFQNLLRHKNLRAVRLVSGHHKPTASVEHKPAGLSRMHFASTAAHTTRFLLGLLQRKLSEGRRSLVRKKLQSFRWSSQLGDNNVHLEAAAAALGCKSTSRKPHLGRVWDQIWALCGWCRS